MIDRMSSASRLVGPGRGAASGHALRVWLALASLLAPGCAAFRPSESGYLGDYSQLRKDPFHLNWGLGLQRARSRFASAETVAQFDSYYVEPVRWLVPESNRASRDPARRVRLCSVLDRALREELGQLKPIVAEPGPRTARIRSAITVVELGRPYLNLALTATLVTPVAIGPVFVGSGVVEVEALAPDGTQVAALSCASAGGLIDLVGYYTRNGHVKKAMRRAAHEVKETLEGR